MSKRRNTSEPVAPLATTEEVIAQAVTEAVTEVLTEEVIAQAVTEVLTEEEIAQAVTEVLAPVTKTKKAPVVSTSGNAARQAGVTLYNLAGKPTKEQFLAVYGERGHKATWVERTAAGCDAEHFQEFLLAGKTAIIAKKAKATVTPEVTAQA